MALGPPAVHGRLEPLGVVEVALHSVVHLVLASIVSLALDLSETETGEEVCSDGFRRIDKS
jgi:hypothetical protein